MKILLTMLISLSITLLIIISYAIEVLIFILIILFVLKLIGWIFGIPLLLHIFTTLRNVKI